MRPSPGQLLKRAGVPAFLVTNLTNVRYLSGMALTAGSILVTKHRYMLFVDSRYRERAEKSVQASVSVRGIDEAQALLTSSQVCGIEAETVTVAKLATWKKKYPNTKFIQSNGIVEEFRRTKDAEELRHLRRAERITQEILRRVPSALRRAITEERLARQLQIWALELGADGLAFDPIVAFGTHTSSPHHQPTSRSLKKGHIVQIDVGARVHGYCADMSEVFFTGKPTAQQRSMYELLCDVQEQSAAMIRRGIRTRSVDAHARSLLNDAGVEHAFCHALGHGVGLDIHEGVTLSAKAPDQKLLPHEVVTVEPGVYFPGKFGMRVERMVFVS